MSQRDWEQRKIITAHDPSRRDFMKKVGGAAVGAGLAAGGLFSGPAFASGRTIRLGYVTPRTGGLASFAAADLFVINQMRNQVFNNGITINGVNHPVEIIVRDSQSSPTRAGTVASELILQDGVDLMLVTSTPETTNPVSDQCELNGVPCISTMAPWNPWFFARGGDPAQGFNYTYHFFWGQPQANQMFTTMWNQLDTNMNVAFLFPNDADGNALSDSETGYPPALEEAGFSYTDPGRYQNGTQDFSAQIRAYRNDNCEIITGAPIPPDFTNFWRQAAQQGYQPTICSISKAVLFPEAVEAVGDLGENLSTEVWWEPTRPYSSTLTGQTAQELANEWEEITGSQWTQPLGFSHAVFEVAVDVLKRAQDLDSAESIASAASETQMSTIVGDLDWPAGPVPNVATTPLVGGQWKPGTDHRYDLVVVENGLASEIPLGGELEPINWS